MPESELLEFTRQLRVLLQAGVPLLGGLDLIAHGNPPRHTLHSNDAPSALWRLVQLGLERTQVAHTVHLIVA
ncbi:MAG: hypothetical protein RJA29_2666, partial [Pseudomonadota bacterium]